MAMMSKVAIEPVRVTPRGCALLTLPVIARKGAPSARQASLSSRQNFELNIAGEGAFKAPYPSK
jgi:hypothetical protein